MSDLKLLDISGLNFMSRFFNRLTKQELIYTFAFCSLPIHVWTIINVLYDVPAWILYMNLWDLTGAISLALVYALFVETLPLFLLLALIGWVLLKGRLRDNFITLSFAIVMELTIIALAIQNNERLLLEKGFLLAIFLEVLVGILVAIYLFPRLKAIVEVIAERVVVLVYIYLFFDVLAVIVLVIRNV